MTHLLLLLRDAGIRQITRWDDFKELTGVSCYYVEMPIDTVESHVWIKIDGAILNHVFDARGNLSTIIVGTP